mmetsp:Transcript_26313/g.39996  ORF Transcript_26313/g.39996 Transcript_26313/m.39996 type:complete len:112 (+) Transcript_26313:245-580(+)|eukprot:CAMPEP_0206470176 /NCGR_PEP_ID=MMETSP0324_2-20121206/30763_1 /ASSEMBLY_ACC=CAM_ASM_000836 /TAXON_ID=2866 /ORGANISM="Crypthecodinium cohnii, Strain Seligo" /LENGTH=111 /DNA_ID=CAMNT_0053944163 /DNA_START=240 /DNA_END=575 /DNA_ORIENTATION=+
MAAIQDFRVPPYWAAADMATLRVFLRGVEATLQALQQGRRGDRMTIDELLHRLSRVPALVLQVHGLSDELSLLHTYQRMPRAAVLQPVLELAHDMLVAVLEQHETFLAAPN